MIKNITLTISGGLYFSIIVIILLIHVPTALAWNIGDVFQGMSTNVTKPGSYQDQAASYYAAGGLSMRTSKTSFNPISMTAPSLSMSCNGIDAYLGSFSIISGDELVQLMNNIGAQGDCEITKAIFASVLPQDSAMRESVCKDMQAQSGMEYFDAGKRCRNDLEQKQALQQAQNKDPELMLEDYNIFIKAAEKAGIPIDMRSSIMSMTGTIVVKNKNVYFFDSLAKDEKSRITHLKGGESASIYACDNSSCLNPTLQRNISILPEQSYQGKAKTKLDGLKSKLASNSEFNNIDIMFLSSIGEAVPIYDYITLEATSGVTILDSSSELIASYTLLQHLKEVTSEVRKAVTLLKAKQVADQHLVEYLKALKALDRVQLFATGKWNTRMTSANQIDKRARLIEQHLMVKERS